MISKNELLEEYNAVKELACGVCFFQDEMRDYTYNYWLKSSRARDLLVVSQDEIKDSLALEVISAVPSKLNAVSPTVCELSTLASEFTHVIVVPSSYHGYLKGMDSVERKDLFLCLPIYRCEFSGSESVDEFKELRLHFVPTLNWNRAIHPKLRVYFDNPKTGGGTDESGAILPWPVLLREIGNLNGVSSGFIEVTNWSGNVVEIISPDDGKYILIRNRRDEQVCAIEELLDDVRTFSFS